MRTRFRFQLTMRHILTAVTITALVIWPFALDVHSARREASVVQAIRDLGGTVQMGTPIGSWFPWIPGVFGVEQLGPARGVSIAGHPNLSESDLALVSRLSQLRGLVLHQSHVTDDSLGNVESLAHLEFLDLSDTCITDAGLEHLYALRNLRYLMLQGTVVTDRGADALNDQLPDCRIYRVRQDGAKARWVR